MSEAITGMMMYYFHVCSRKLWYFTHRIGMEHNSEAVRIGKVVDEQNKLLHEVKKSRKIEQAGIWQVKYYLYYLQKLGAEGIKGKIDYPLLKQTLFVELEDGDAEVMDAKLKEIRQIIDSPIVTKRLNKNLCQKCAYYDLCYI